LNKIEAKWIKFNVWIIFRKNESFLSKTRSVFESNCQTKQNLSFNTNLQIHSDLVSGWSISSSSLCASSKPVYLNRKPSILDHKPANPWRYSALCIYWLHLGKKHTSFKKKTYLLMLSNWGTQNLILHWDLQRRITNEGSTSSRMNLHAGRCAVG